jgi:hypothetical protein
MMVSIYGENILILMERHLLKLFFFLKILKNG